MLCEVRLRCTSSVTKLFGYLGRLSFDYVIRFRGNTHVTAATGERRAAADWVGKGGRAVKLSGAMVTAAEHPVGAVVCVHAKGMKEPWCLATSLGDATAREIVDAYAKRRIIEPSFRDTKDIRFGMGLSLLRIRGPIGAIDCCCSTPSRSTCSRCWAPPARNSEWTATSGPAPASAARTPLPVGLHALRNHPQHAGGATPTPHATLRRSDATIKRNFRGWLHP